MLARHVLPGRFAFMLAEIDFAVGLAVGIFQAATQVNDSAVGFLPRAFAAVAFVWLAGGWMMERLSGFLAQAVVRMAGR